MLKNPESPNTVYSSLITRLPMPAFEDLRVTYDFTCKLASYCWYRNWRVFRTVRFMTDDFHHKSHQCFYGFSVRAFRKYNADITNINSGRNEQLNSPLSKLKSAVRYMNVEHGTKIIRHFLEMDMRRIDRAKTKSFRTSST